MRREVYVSSCDVIHREKLGRFMRNCSVVAGKRARGFVHDARRGRDILIVGKRRETRCERIYRRCAFARSLARSSRRKIARGRYHSLPSRRAARSNVVGYWEPKREEHDTNRLVSELQPTRRDLGLWGLLPARASILISVDIYYAPITVNTAENFRVISASGVYRNAHVIL